MSVLALLVVLAQPQPSFEPRPFDDQRADAILLDEVVRADRWWVQGHVISSIYDARRDVLIGRLSPGVAAGRRFTRWGVFAAVELDQTFDFTLDTRRLDVMTFGLGGEFLNFIGHVRSSLTLGATVLLSETEIDEAGEVGWFIDLRPGALRWGFGDNLTLEFSPLTFDVIAPVIEGIPLLVFSYMTGVGVEWSFEQ